MPYDHGLLTIGFPLIRPAIKPLISWGGYVARGGGRLTSHDKLSLSRLLVPGRGFISSSVPKLDQVFLQNHVSYSRKTVLPGKFNSSPLKKRPGPKKESTHSSNHHLLGATLNFEGVGCVSDSINTTTGTTNFLDSLWNLYVHMSIGQN